MIETKVCFKCKRELPLSEFYKHPRMGDGHLNKCKECAKKDVREKYIENSANEAYMDKERARGREKYSRLGYRNRSCTGARISKRMLYTSCCNVRRDMHVDVKPGYELHHWNYRNNHEVIMLNRSLHSRLHTKINLDVDAGYYFLGDKPLDTIEKHLSVVKSVCDEFGYDYSEVKVLTKQ